MNEDKDTREDFPNPEGGMEERIVALIVGETSPEESAELMEAIERDEDLKAKFESFSESIGCIEEAVTDEGASSDADAPLRLSNDRRERVFGAENAVSPERKLIRINFGHPLVGMGVAACFLCAFLFIMKPSVSEYRETARKSPSSEIPSFKDLRMTFDEAAPDASLDDQNNTPMGDSNRKVKLLEPQAVLEEKESTEGTRALRVDAYKGNTSLADSPMLEDIVEKEGESGFEADSKQPLFQLESINEIEIVRAEAARMRLDNVRYFEDVDSSIRAPALDAASADFRFSRETASEPKEQISISEFGIALSEPKNVPSKAQAVREPLFEYKELPDSALANNEVFELSPFTVDGSKPSGYRASRILSGSRLKDVPAAGAYAADFLDTLPMLMDADPVEVITSEYIEDRGNKKRSNAPEPPSLGFGEVIAYYDFYKRPMDTAQGTAAALAGGSALIGGLIGAPSNASENGNRKTMAQLRINKEEVTKGDELLARGLLRDEVDVALAKQYPGLYSEEQLIAEHSILAADFRIVGESTHEDSQFFFGDLSLVSGLRLTDPLNSEAIYFGDAEATDSDVGDTGESIAKPSNLVVYPEFITEVDPLSTFSLNVSDVSFRLAESHLMNYELPRPGTIRTEEFYNAFDYRDPVPELWQKVGFVWERSEWPFEGSKELVRLAIRAAAEGRLKERPLKLTLAIDSSGSMARADRIEILNSMLASLSEHLGPQDVVSVVAFGRDTRLVADARVVEDGSFLIGLASRLNPHGGTDLERGLSLAYSTARKNFDEAAINRVVLITDGAANLGNTLADDLSAMVEENRRQGIAIDCFGVGFDGHNDSMLERISRNGDGRYRFIRSASEVQKEFGEKLAGMLRPAAYDVKVQVEFSSERVRSYQLLGYQKREIADEDFRNDAVDAAELSAEESGNALYLLNIDHEGEGDIGVVHVRFRNASSNLYEELSWNLPYTGRAVELESASGSLRLAATAAGFAAMLNESPSALKMEYGDLLNLSLGLERSFIGQKRVETLSELIRRASQLSGRK